MTHMQAVAHTTIAIDPKIRDQLKKHGNAGDTYNDILDRLMAIAEKEEFLAYLKKIEDEPDLVEYVSIEEWDRLEGWDPSSW